MNSEAEIDDSFYSRQRYMLGDSAMKRLAESSVLVYGLGGLGVEIAKNLALAGVKLLTVQDWKICAMSDLGTQFFIRHEDVVAKKSRVEASAGRLAELNPHVSVSTVTEQLTSTTNLDYLLQYQCVILTECPQLLQVKVDNFCRTQPSPIRFICCDVYGVFGCTFCDFGENFYVCDPTGEDPEEVFIGNVTKANPGVVTCLENYVHGLQTEDVVIFKEVQGMDLLNMRQFHVKVLSPTSFSIDNTSGDEFGKYLCGGMLKKVKLPVNVKFNSLSEEITSPTFLYPDLGKLNSSENVHLAFRALHAYIAETGYLPELWCNSAADCMLELAEEVNKSRLKNQVF